ncbi:histidinol-phosphate transaminase [Actinotalea sp.]|uniref:histidinol-phosphate transaminase n=1 Tax=Actinotalea sp. TaxID=1872145 RepID=UPI00356B4F0A
MTVRPWSPTSVRPRAAVAQLPAYVPGARTSGGDQHKLSSNENPFAPLDSVREAVAAAAGQLNRYPDMFAGELVEALAARHGVGPESVVAGCGSVAVLGHVLQAFCEPGGQVVSAWRSFEAYPILVGLQGAEHVRVPVDAEGRHDLPGMAEAVTPTTDAVIVCSPNNPTGPAVHHEELATLLGSVPESVPVVLDEAYLEFVRDPAVADGDRLLAEHPNLVLLRTFSKAYGLAALRVGYAVAHPEIAQAVRTSSTPFGVNHLAQVAALASLEAERELAARVDEVVAERGRLVTGLRAQGWTVPDPQGNFVWLGLGGRTLDLARDAAEHGVLVRPFAGEGMRISVGTPEATEAVLELTRAWKAVDALH